MRKKIFNFWSLVQHWAEKVDVMFSRESVHAHYIDMKLCEYN